MQSTALALMACENKQKGLVNPQVPVYDAIIFCDLGCEPPWVYSQVDFIASACECFGIPFYVLITDLYDDYIQNFGNRRVVSVPFWSVGEDGKKAKMTRHCTIDYKILAIQKFFKYTLLGYRKYERIKPVDREAHEMHIGFSSEEKQRIFDSKHPMLVNRFPLIEMGLQRKDNYKYILEVWGLDTKASACAFCPFHRNYFFKYIKENCKKLYDNVMRLDEVLESKQENTSIKSKLFISRSRKRLSELTDADCDDAETFRYLHRNVWNGF